MKTKKKNLYFLSSVTNENCLAIINDDKLTPLARYMLIDMLHNYGDVYNAKSESFDSLRMNTTDDEFNEAYTLLYECGYIKRIWYDNKPQLYVAPDADFDFITKYNFN